MPGGEHGGQCRPDGAHRRQQVELNRAEGQAFLFEFGSYADKYALAGVPVHLPAGLRPRYPWSLALRDDHPDAVTDFLDIAIQTADSRGTERAERMPANSRFASLARKPVASQGFADDHGRVEDVAERLPHLDQ